MKTVEYTEWCPYCGHESHGKISPYKLVDNCSHCGKEIVICSWCPHVCHFKEWKSQGIIDYCVGCPHYNYNCIELSCNSCEYDKE